jgi:hypothetical protein
LVGFVDAVHKKGSEQSRIRTTFATVPDAPASKAVISLNVGKKKRPPGQLGQHLQDAQQGDREDEDSERQCAEH